MGRLLEWGLGLFVPEATKRGASLSEICTLTPFPVCSRGNQEGGKFVRNLHTDPVFPAELELLAPLWEV
jgi:hypothetical protein